MPEDIVVYLVAAVILLLVALLLQGWRYARRSEENFRKLKEDVFYQIASENRFQREELESRLDRLRDSLMAVFESGRESNRKAIGALSTEMNEGMHRFLRHTTEGMEGIRTSVDEKLAGIQTSNEKKLDEMRFVVNEKLEKTLETRLQKSFETVSTQLESVNKGLGEMRTVAQSVGSLNRILAGSKSRGILGEVQLGSIIEDMLPTQLYEREIATKAGSSGRVEYAVKLPGAEEGGHVFLPIDSKFPLETYERLLDCYETGDPEETEAARKALLARIKAFAKDIRDKYISPPETTHFAVMFLPTEGLYAEVAREAAFFEALRQDGIIITGPTTFSAMLNSLQLGFKTLQIQKGAADIEKTLGAVKKEFTNFESVLKKAHQRITQTGTELENLIGTRTNAINRSLRDVQVYTGEENVLGLAVDE
ncbi:MAG: DNA recombination protein RmuC [Defluviitaleaceae bacterium]|nr:DNA recombination protein RmuC [Defluviitaleaceae bacterium]MCL2263836.1 DNA recombination protein RmuC [Defluviitaleaceae bacterium]